MSKRSFGARFEVLAAASACLSIILSVFSVAPSAFAASGAAQELSASCPDYKANSVPVVLHADRPNVSAGSKVSLRATVSNKNDFPIVAGSLFVKVTKQGDDVLVDRYAALENVTLFAQESKDLSFDWSAPSALPAGPYKVEAFFVSAKQFVLSGSGASDKSAAVTLNVSGDAKGLVSFDKASATVNGAPYASSLSTAYDAGAPLAFKVNVSNATGKAQSVSVLWKLYYWDGISEETLIDQRVGQVDLAAGKSAPVSYTVADSAHASYQLVAEAQYSGGKSFVTLRASRSVSEPIVRFIGLKPFPSQNKAVSVFGCVHNTIVDAAQGNKIKVTLAEGSGKVVDSAEYDVSKTPVVGFVRNVRLDGVANQEFSLSAAVVGASKAVRQRVSVVYDCSMVPSAPCPSLAQSGASKGGSSWMDRNAGLLMTTFAALAVVMLLAEVRRRKKLTTKK